MQLHIFAEGSGTTEENPNTELKNYYQGLFRQVISLEEDLSKYGETELHIVSTEFGIANGDDLAKNIIDKEIDKPMVAVRNELLSTADSDVLVILLSTDVFEQTVTDSWPKLVPRAKNDGIWCLGASRSALESVSLDNLEDKECSLITYQRVGVARLGTESRKKLYEEVERKAEAREDPL